MLTSKYLFLSPTLLKFNLRENILLIIFYRPSFVLQAETEDEMREWMAAFEKAKRLMLQTEKLDFKNGTAMNNMSVVDYNESTTTLAAADSLSNLSVKSKPTTCLDELPAIVDNTTKDTTTDTTTTAIVERPSIVMLSTSPENGQRSLTQSTSLTPLLVWEASRAAMNPVSSAISPPTSPLNQSFSAAAKSLDATLKDYNEKEDSANGSANAVTTNNTTTASSSSSWGIPWALVPSMFQGASSDDISSELPPTPGGSPNVPAITDSDGHQVIWPTRVDDSNFPKVDLVGYPASLDARNRELRHLFGGVGPNEVVLDGKS